MKKRIKSLDNTRPIRSRSDKGKSRKKYKLSKPALYNTYVKRANAKGILMDLTVEEFIALTTDTDCAYCGNAASVVSRSDPKKGYTKDNSVPACSTCTLMKNILSANQFIKQVKAIYFHITCN
jgi:hypothetical protein